MGQGDSYSYPGTDVLKNRVHLKDGRALSIFEREKTSVRLYQLEENPIRGRFDFDHLCRIHHHIFQDVYEWAGKPRNVSISKGNSMFCLPQHLDSFQRSIFEPLAKENHLTGLDREAFVDRTAHYLGEINALHPFREGNGRAQREFLRELALDAGWVLDWSRISETAMREASERSTVRGDNSGLREILADAVSSKTHNLETIRGRLGLASMETATKPGQHLGPVLVIDTNAGFLVQETARGKGVLHHLRDLDKLPRISANAAIVYNDTNSRGTVAQGIEVDKAVQKDRGRDHDGGRGR